MTVCVNDHVIKFDAFLELLDDGAYSSCNRPAVFDCRARLVHIVEVYRGSMRTVLDQRIFNLFLGVKGANAGYWGDVGHQGTVSNA